MARGTLALRTLVASLLCVAAVGCGSKVSATRAADSAAALQKRDDLVEVVDSGRAEIDKMMASMRGEWRRETFTNEMDDTPGLSFTTMATITREERAIPTLTLICRDHKTMVYLATGVVQGTDGMSRVRLRLDQAPAESQSWHTTTDNHYLVPNGAVALLRRLTKADTLRIEYQPYGSGSAVATFALAGIDTAVAELSTFCKWPRS